MEGLMKITEQDVVIIFMRNFIDPGKIRIGTDKKMIAKQAKDLIDILSTVE
jgi:hypothetical protein